VYNLRLLDQHRQRVAIIDQYVSWQYTRRLSPDGSITVSLPRSAVDASMPEGQDVYAVLSPYQIVLQQSQTTVTQEPPHTQAQVAHFVEIYRDTDHVVTGRISTRNIGDDVVTITCHTEEIVLESHTAPAQYSRVYDGWDLADVARHQLHGWHTLRCKDQTQWADAIEAVNVNMTTEPGAVMLTKSGGRYVADGHVTVRFNRADVPNFVSWDRIRWASDNGDPVRTTMQYRYDGGPWSDEVEGALTDEIGIVPGTTDADSIDVRINLYTDDRDTEDGEGNPVGQSPWVFAVELIARTEGQVTAGDIPASAGVTVRGLDVDGSNSLAILSAACEQAGWEFTVEQGRLSIAKELGDDRSHEVLLRTGTNLNVETLTDGDDELVNILTAYGPGQGINRLQVTRVHEASVQRYGPYPHKQEFDDVSTLADLIQAADEYLEQHALITPAFVVQPVHPYDADDVPKYGRGDYVRVADPTNGIITTSRIVEERRQGSVQGERVTLYLGLPPASLGDAIRPRPDKPPAEDATPPHVTVTPIEGGLRIVDTSTPSAGWTATECHVSTESNFEPSSVTLAQRDRLSRFTITGLEPVRHFVRLIRIVNGRRSEPSEERSATPIKPYEPDLTPPDAPVIDTLVPQAVDLGNGRSDVSVTVPFTADARTMQVVIERRERIGTDPDIWGDWSEVGAATSSPWIDRGGLRTETVYQYRARAISSEGVKSILSNVRQVTIPAATVKPPQVAGLTADFSGPDCILTWQPVAGATGYRVQVRDGDGVRRERTVSSTDYTYTYEANKADGTPSPALTVRVWAINQWGNESEFPAELPATNAEPTIPTIRAESSQTQIRWRITSDIPTDLHSVTVVAGDYNETTTATSGVIDLADTGAEDAQQLQVYVTLTDMFGQSSDPGQDGITARWLTEQDMAGEIFQIRGRIYGDDGEDIEPDLGSVEDLWDGDTVTEVQILNVPPGNTTVYIEYEFPIETMFEMVSVYVTSQPHDTRVRAEVEQRDGSWQAVTNWVPPTSDWTHWRFDNGRIYAARRIRLAVRNGYGGSIYLSQLKFGTTVTADSIYGGIMRLTGNMAIESEEGNIKIVPRRIAMHDENNDIKGVIGNVEGIPWGSTTLPSEWAAWFGKGGIYLAEYPRLIMAGIADSGDVIIPGTSSVPGGKQWIIITVPVGTEVDGEWVTDTPVYTGQRDVEFDIPANGTDSEDADFTYVSDLSAVTCFVQTDPDTPWLWKMNSGEVDVELYDGGPQTPGFITVRNKTSSDIRVRVSLSEKDVRLFESIYLQDTSRTLQYPVIPSGEYKDLRLIYENRGRIPYRDITVAYQIYEIDT